MFSANNPDISSGGIKEFPVSQKENEWRVPCFLTEIKKSDVNGKPALDFVFVYNNTNNQNDPSNGAKFTHREWDPTIDPPRVTRTEKEREDEYTVVMSRILHICSRYVDENTIRGVQAETWENYCDVIAQSMVKYLKDERGNFIPAEVKAVYNKKNWVAFPRYPDFISTAFKPAKFTWNPTYDKNEKTEVAPSPIANMNAGMVSTPPSPPLPSVPADQSAPPPASNAPTTQGSEEANSASTDPNTGGAHLF